MMKVLIVNTSERAGGAAIAASRLMQALKQEGVEVSMLTRRNNFQFSIFNFQFSIKPLAFYWERLRIFAANGFSKERLWYVDIACSAPFEGTLGLSKNCGEDITRTHEFQEADIIHLHYINQGFLSLKVLDKILRSGKRVVWTMHDMWPFTGICHHADACERYQTHCHDCPLLVRPSAKDLSYKVFEKKQHVWQHGDITFVGCSKWIAELASKSRLTKGHRVVNIPNVVPHSTFHPMSKTEARTLFGLPADKKLLLFSCQKVSDERKGMSYMLEALQLLKDENIALVVAGSEANITTNLPIHAVGYIADEERMAALYAAVDVFVTPSLQENLPNTIAEAMSCGTPCVGFHIGGIPEMIHHKVDGYVARYRDANDLAEGIRHVLSHPELGEAAARYAHDTYNAHRIAQLYIEEYKAPLPAPPVGRRAAEAAESL